MTHAVDAVRALLERAAVASLATLDGGDPALSLVPFVSGRDPVRLHLFVSELSPHTAALRADPRCAVMLHDPPVDGDPRSNHALTRLMLQCTARFLTRDEAKREGIEDAYRAKYPIADTLLGLGDFHFVTLTPVADRGSFVQGFGRAFHVRGANLDELHHVKGR